MSTLSIDFMMLELMTLNFNCKEGIWKWNKQGLKKVELLTALLDPWEHFYEALKSDISHKFDTYKTVCIRGGVKLEFIRNSLDLIQKFVIGLIGKGKKYSKIQ